MTHRETGLLVDPYDSPAFTQQILDVLESPAQYQSLQEAARVQMVKHFGFEVCLPQLAEFYLFND